MRILVTLLAFLCCVLSGGAEEWDKVGNWKGLGMIMFKSDAVAVKYDAANVMFPGIGRPEPSMDFILLVIYPKQMNGRPDKDRTIFTCT